VTISGTPTISITAQTVGVHIESEWETKQGTDVSFYGTGAVATNTETDFAVPYDHAKTLYITDWGWSMDDDSGLRCGILQELIAPPYTQTILSIGAGKMGFATSSLSPVVLDGATVNLKARIYQNNGVSQNVQFFFRGYQI
jgi:hypothetical protein